MKRGIVYYNHGTGHLARLVVSLYSLRRFYAGPVRILDSTPAGQAGQQAREILKLIAGDKRLDVKAMQIPFIACRKNSCYVVKSTIPQHSPFDATLLLDADTVVAADPSPLLGIVESEPSGFVVTRFSNWITQGEIIGGRIRRWAGVECRGIDVAGLVRKSLGEPHAAINTGCVGFRADAEILKWWAKLTLAGAALPFTDELAAQILIREFKHTLVSERFNASPIYRKCHPDEVVIWHAHGGKNILREDGRGAQGHEIWWPVFDECCRTNVGGIADWAPAGDKRLGDYLARLRKSA